MARTLELFQQLANLMLQKEDQYAVAPYLPASELYDQLDLNLSEEPMADADYQESLSRLLEYTPKTATPGFFNQLFGGRNPDAVLGDLLAVMLNNSMYTYKAAGPQVGVEKVIINTLNRVIGWGQGGGTFGPGGSMTNLMGMIMARDSRNPSVPFDGIKNKMTVYTSAESHYSVPKNAAFCGIGREQVRYISCDEQGRIQPKALKDQIEKDINAGYLPVLVNLTAGTTVLGSFDPIEEVAQTCREYNIWLHVDGAYCGSVLLSKKYKHLIQGIEKADSFSLNAHKMLGTPLSCSLLLVRDQDMLYNSFSNDAAYLYQTDRDEFNLGKTSLQCGRRNDALKLWTLWKRVGTTGLEQLVNHQFDLADHARNYIENHPDYTLFSFPDSVSVCFNYKGIDAPTLCTALYEQSRLLVGYGSFDGDEFIRLVTVNGQNSIVDIDNFFNTIEDFVQDNQALFGLTDPLVNQDDF
ncbi:pyridoxal phosphate-dependent decarboxylase family protein [Aureitalea marina]|uniref:Cysteine synthase n=1 Tax=Aureitalea marina TaxID=930804 RepID=A0A2S7KTX1_9FLAO|nr:aminotransferase class V-fold PLP-dependent enzyme [Aureitalea marina]PQB05973.1 cysteine synthase [Aureitalea marina]